MMYGSVLYLIFWAFLFVFMMRFGCGAHIMGHHHHPRQVGSHGDMNFPSDGMARDPVCGMKVSITSAKSSVRDGQPYYFCSQNCREKFEASPSEKLEQNSETHGKELRDGTA